MLRPNARRKNLIGLPFGCLFIDLFYIGMPVVPTNGWTYSHVITKISRMGRLPHFLKYGATLERARRAWSSAMNVFCHYPFLQNMGRISVVLGSTGCRVRAAGLGGGSGGMFPIEISKIGLSLNTISCVPWTGIG